VRARTFDELVEEGRAQSLVGWDFTWLNARTREEPLPWDYRAAVLERLLGAGALLDVGTGGGEFLAGLAPLAPVTWATEGYRPNVSVARARLEPLGVRVADVSSITDGRLPFDAATFDLIIDRHEGAPASELARVLKSGGRYLTQQVGGENCLDLNRFLEDTPTFQYMDCTLAGMARDLETAGFRILDTREAFPKYTFLDIAGVVFYLHAIPWQIPGFTVEKYRQKLTAIHELIQKEGGFTVREHRFLIEAALY
jgi:SAM-dependent methyltransferase